MTETSARGAAPSRAAERPAVTVSAACAHCRGAVELACEGLPGFWGYETYNEYFCPHCRKQNHQLTPGAIVAARAPAA
jgi:hypothetical protein